jgi:hypothetical protein
VEDLQRTAQAASHALSDPEYRKEVLDGDQDEPEVRNALLADLGAAEASGGEGDEVNLPSQTPNLQQLIDRAKSW